MKKIISLILFTALIVNMAPSTSILATTKKTNDVVTSIIKNADGGYYVETITESYSREALTTRSTSTKSKTKNIKYYNSHSANTAKGTIKISHNNSVSSNTATITCNKNGVFS